MIYNMILYYIIETVKNLFRSKVAAFVTMITMTVSILLCVLSLFLIIVSNRIENKIAENIEIQLFLADSVENNMVSDLSAVIKSKSFVESVEFRDSEKAKEEFLKLTGQDFTGVLEDNPLPSSFSVKLKKENVREFSVAEIIQELESLDGIVESAYSFDHIFELLDFINSVKFVIYLLSILLISASFYLTYSLNRLIIHSKKEHFNTMKLVGAKLKTIKIPLLLNGIVLGFFSAVISIIIIVIALTFLHNLHLGFNFTKYLYIVNLTVLIMGLLFGFLSCLLSVRKISLRIM